MKCEQCKSELTEGAKLCPACGHIQGWDRPCPLCRSLLHRDATFCVHCSNDISSHNATFLVRLVKLINLPVATLTSVLVLVVTLVGLIGTLETLIDKAPVISVFPSGPAPKPSHELKFMFYNSGERIAHVESATLRAKVYENAQTSKEIEGGALRVKSREEQILYPEQNAVTFEAINDKWDDEMLAGMRNREREKYFEHETLCVLSLVIRDTRSNKQIEPASLSFTGEACAKFLQFRFGS